MASFHLCLHNLLIYQLTFEGTTVCAQLLAGVIASVSLGLGGATGAMLVTRFVSVSLSSYRALQHGLSLSRFSLFPEPLEPLLHSFLRLVWLSILIISLFSDRFTSRFSMASRFNVVFVLGPPGSGKGTQCKRIHDVSIYTACAFVFLACN